VSGAPVPLRVPENPSSLAVRLAEALRPEFAGTVIRVDPDDPVFGRGRCSVAGCERTAWSRLLCMAHYNRWHHAGKPDVEAFAATTGPVRTRAGSVDAFDLSRLRPHARAEVAYVLQCRHDDRAIRIPPTVVSHLIALLAGSGCESLLDRPVQHWIEAVRAKGLRDPSRTIGLVRYAHRRLGDLATDHDVEAEYGADTWAAARLGLVVNRPPRSIRFDAIAQLWLRAATKRFARHRLGSGKAFGSVSIDVRAVRRFAAYLARTRPRASDESAVTRELLEGYLGWMAGARLAAHTRNTDLICLRGFLQAARRHRWLPGLAADATLYADELGRRPDGLPRFIPEHVMAQLERPENLARLPDPTSRHLVVVLMETGLRANDGCMLAFNPVIDDSVGWPCLRFHNAKMAAEQLVPLSARAAEAIGAQQDYVRQRWPAGAACLFPAPFGNPDGDHPFSYGTLRERLARWQELIDVRDEAGRPYRATAHQFRHTLGTRLINSGVPQHVVQRLLGHATPQMTARYARIHDATVRAAFEDYCRQRVDVVGRRIGFDPEAPTAEAEWVKHNLARIQASLPNGYCGRPPQQDCPHPNACLTCPDFQTTPEFLDIHRRQRDQTAVLIATAEANGQFRLVDNHRRVAENLEHIITALESMTEGDDRGVV
jgi:integrase